MSDPAELPPLPRAPSRRRAQDWVRRLLVACVTTPLACGAADDASSTSLTEPRGGSEGAPALADAGACPQVVRAVPYEGSLHLAEGTELVFDSNPPASGDHYPVWTRFEAFEPEVVARGYWLHNLEHGGIALLAGPNADEHLRRQLREVYDELPPDPACGGDHSRALFTVDEELDDPIAVVAWGHVLEADCVDRAAIVAFVLEHRGRAPEDICTHGSYVP